MVWKADYKPFGEAVVDSGSTVVNDFRFPGQYYDSETGLHYNWNRYYDPGTGRYLTPDPIGLWGGINLYAYVGGNPVNYYDYKGLSWRDPYLPYIDPTNLYLPRCYESGYCEDTFPPDYYEPNENKYCTTYSHAISCFADGLQVGAIIATVSTGGTAAPGAAVASATATVIAVSNGVVSLLLCGPSASSVTTAAGVMPGSPPWLSVLISAVDIALNATGN